MRSLFAGPEVTPRRGSTIVTLAHLGVSFRKIEQMTNVKKSTANNIFRHAETNTMDNRIKAAIDSAMARDSGAIEECLRNMNAGERASAGMDELLARIQHSMRRLNLSEAETPDPRPAAQPEPDPERILDRVVGTELSLQELIAADVLDPKK
jgi:seryl-tRNA synthetase